MPQVTTHAYIINNRFNNNPCDVPIVCGNYSVLGYGWFVRVSNVFSNGCGGYFEIGTEIPENYTVGHDPSEFIKLLHVQSGSTNIWVSQTVDELINLCKCTPTNFTLIVDNGDGTYTAIFPTGSGLSNVTWGSGGGSGFDGEVLISADLPDPTLHTDEIWFVKTGVDAGPYYSDGVTWFSPLTNILLDINNLQTDVNILLANGFKITYYEIVSGASGTITPPVGSTFNSDEFGNSGNSILSKINVANKPTFESPQTAGGVVVTANLNTVTGAWTASGVYTDPQVALIYSIGVPAQFLSNLNNFYIIETVEINNPSALLKVDDTNVGLTLTGNASVALLQPITIAVNWIGTLADGRIASAATWNAKVSPSRNINTTAPIVGGGDLSADRTISTLMNTNKLIGRGSLGAGVMEEITLGTNLSLAGNTLNAANPAPALTNAHIFVGNGSNVATDVAMSGDTTIDNLGAVTIGVNKVNYDKLDVEGELAIIAAFRFLSRN
jgi:hypothetical protein